MAAAVVAVAVAPFTAPPPHTQRCWLWQELYPQLYMTSYTPYMLSLSLSLTHTQVLAVAGAVLAVVAALLYPTGYFGPLSARVRGTTPHPSPPPGVTPFPPPRALG